MCRKDTWGELRAVEAQVCLYLHLNTDVCMQHCISYVFQLTVPQTSEKLSLNTPSSKIYKRIIAITFTWFLFLLIRCVKCHYCWKFNDFWTVNLDSQISWSISICSLTLWVILFHGRTIFTFNSTRKASDHSLISVQNAAWQSIKQCQRTLI